MTWVKHRIDITLQNWFIEENDQLYSVNDTFNKTTSSDLINKT